MMVKLSTDKMVSETAAALQVAILANHFGVRFTTSKRLFNVR